MIVSYILVVIWKYSIAVLAPQQFEVSVNTQSGFDSTMPGRVRSAAHFLNFQPTSAISGGVFAIASQLNSPAAIKLFNRNAELLGSISTTYINTYSMKMKEPSHLYLFNRDTNLNTLLAYQLSQIGNQVSINFDQSFNSQDETTYLIACPGSQYIYILCYLSSTYVKADLNFFNSRLVSSIPEMHGNGKSLICPSVDLVAFVTLFRSKSGLIDISNLQLVHLFDFLLINIQSIYSVQDNLNSSSTYTTTKPVSTTNGEEMMIYNFNTSILNNDIPGVIQGPASLGPAVEAFNEILNCGPYLYLIVLSSSSTSLFIFTKPDLQRTDLAVKETPGFFCLIGNDFSEDWTKTYFGYVSSISNNYQAYYLVFDRCVKRNVLEPLQCELCLPSMYFDQSFTHCLLLGEFPPNHGVDTATNAIHLCSSQYCLDCTNNYLSCSSCDTQSDYYLNPSDLHCIHSSTIPSGYGINRQTLSIVSCLVIHCLKCTQDHTLCKMCEAGYSMNTTSNVCVKFEDFASNQGKRADDSTVQFCDDGLCVNCKDDYSRCVECGVGFSVSSWKCVNETIVNKAIKPDVVSIPVSARDNMDIAFLIKMDDNCTLGFTKLFRSKILTGLSFFRTDNESIEEQINYYTINKTISEGIIKVSVYLISINSSYEKDIKVVLRSKFEGSIVIEDDKGLQYLIEEFEGFVLFDMKDSEALNRNQTALTPESQIAHDMTILASAQNTIEGSSFVAFLLSLNMFQIGFRFTEILQLVNKLYYLSVYHGRKLEPFLLSIAEITRGKNTSLTEINSRAFRYKLSKQHLTLNPLEIKIFTFKMVCYIISVLLQLLKSLVLNTAKITKTIAYFCYFFDKFHNVMYHIVIYQSTWFISRSLLHSSDSQPIETKSIFLISMIIISLDSIYIINKVFFRYLRTSMAKRITSDFEINPSRILSKSSQTINQLKTRRKLELNIELMRLICTRISYKNPSISRSLTCKLVAIGFYTRIIIFTLTIISLQQSPYAQLAILICVEIANSVSSIYVHLRFRYYSSLLYLLMDVSQSILFSFYMALILFTLSSSRYKSNVKPGYQIAGIWIIISSCVIEYLLLMMIVFTTISSHCDKKKTDLDYKHYLIIYDSNGDGEQKKRDSSGKDQDDKSKNKFKFNEISSLFGPRNELKLTNKNGMKNEKEGKHMIREIPSRNHTQKGNGNLVKSFLRASNERRILDFQVRGPKIKSKSKILDDQFEL